MKPKLLTTGAAVVLLGGTVAGLALAWGSAAKQPPANPTLPPATAMSDRMPPSDPGTTVYGNLSVIWCDSASRESLSCPLCSPTGVFHSSAPDRAFSA